MPRKFGSGCIGFKIRIGKQGEWLGDYYDIEHFRRLPDAVLCAVQRDKERRKFFFFLVADRNEGQRSKGNRGRAGRNLYAAGHMRIYSRTGTVGQAFRKESGICGAEKFKGGKKKQKDLPPRFLE